MYNQILEQIQKSSHVVLISHINPDGDALGSSLALYHAILKLGKKVTICNSTKEIAKKFDFLPSFNKIRNTLPSRYDLLISCDCGSFDRLAIERVEVPIINIDHHKSNTEYGTINIVEPDSPSTTMVVFSMLESFKIKMDAKIATCIYTGIVEDTDFFVNQNTDKAVFKMSAKLINYGVDSTKVAYNLLQRESLAKVRLKAILINSIELKQNAKVGIGIIRQEDLNSCGAMRSDCDNLINIIRSLVTVEIAILLIEEKNSEFKVSLRSKIADVESIATKFGGGGHHYAAGFQSNILDLKELIDKILYEVKI